MIHHVSQSVSFPSLSIDTPRVLVAMGYGNAVPDTPILEQIDRMIGEASEHCEASYAFCVDDAALVADTIRVGSTLFDVGRIIARSLRGSKSVAIFTATAGIHFQRWMDSFGEPDDLLNRFIADSIGTEVAEAAAGVMQQAVAGWASQQDMKHTNRFSPGYCGWHVQEQHKLFSLVGEDNYSITLTASGLMYPIKSVSGIIGLGPDVRLIDYTCKLCDFQFCFRRKTKQ